MRQIVSLILQMGDDDLQREQEPLSIHERPAVLTL